MRYSSRPKTSLWGLRHPHRVCGEAGIASAVRLSWCQLGAAGFLDSMDRSELAGLHREFHCGGLSARRTVSLGILDPVFALHV